MSELDLIETDRLILSGWRHDQLPDLIRMHGDPEITRYYSASGAPWSAQRCATVLDAWIAQFEREQMGKLRLTRKADGVLVGRAGFGTHEETGEPEIGFTLFREFRGQGYATEAASALRDWIFRETDWDHFIGMADARNDASRKVLRGIGMRETRQEPEGGRMLQFHLLTRDQWLQRP